MNRRSFLSRVGAFVTTAYTARTAQAQSSETRTQVAIQGERFLINGRPTYAGRSWEGHRIEGLLLNARTVQGIFDDLNPETRTRWAYPDSGQWDAERNTREFIAAMPEWKANGVSCITLSLQGGNAASGQGGVAFSTQPWHNSAFESDGNLRAAYFDRLRRILNTADALGMVVILGYFYFGQDERVANEMAIVQGTRAATKWVLSNRFSNVLVEIANETDSRTFHHDILKPARVHELIELARGIHQGGRRLLVGTSFIGGAIPTPAVLRASDFVLLHGNSVTEPTRIAAMVDQVRQLAEYRPMPILFNEDDHYNFDQSTNNMQQALSRYASWGYHDPGTNNYNDGFQCPPVNWRIKTERKRSFFELCRRVSGVS